MKLHYIKAEAKYKKEDLENLSARVKVLRSFIRKRKNYDYPLPRWMFVISFIII